MPFYGMMIRLNGKNEVQKVLFSSGFAEGMLRKTAGSLVGVPVGKIPHFQLDLEKGTLVWEGCHFSCCRIEDPPGGLLLIQEENVCEQLLAEIVNRMTDALQLYDAGGNIQFFNRAARRMMGISLKDEIRGQRLLDVFAVDPQYSTTLTALATRKPVAQRYDHYKSTTGKDLMTVNDGWPVFRPDGSLLGAVVREQDVGMIKKELARLQENQQILTRHLTRQLSNASQTRYTFDDIIGSSALLQAAVQLAKQMALKEMNILIQGETGSGKEMFAQGIHAFSSRKKEKFLAVNCAAFPESLIESMLFGTSKGAFTGSTEQAGLLEAANHGTLFLDEMNSMSLGMQAKLLRVLEEKKVQRIGSTREIPIDVRVISSCNEDPFQLMEQGKIRRDLFYRLASVIIEVPPLRERMGDLDELVSWYLQKHKDGGSQPIHTITPRFWQQLRNHDWPGNVRELFHILNYALSMSQNGILDTEDFPTYFLRHQQQRPKEILPTASERTVDYGQGLNSLVQEYEKQLLADAYLHCGCNATKTAELLKISRQNFQYYARKYHLQMKKEK
jgi:arginine utilization regulatory protein